MTRWTYDREYDDQRLELRSEDPLAFFDIRPYTERLSEAEVAFPGSSLKAKGEIDLLRQAFNWALFRLWEKGRFTDLWLRYFPVSPF